MNNNLFNKGNKNKKRMESLDNLKGEKSEKGEFGEHVRGGFSRFGYGDFSKVVERYTGEVRDICKLKGYSENTIKIYELYIKSFLEFLYKSGLNLDVQGVKYYLLSVDVSNNSARLIYSALKFFFCDVLKRPFTCEDVPVKKREKKLPNLLSKEVIDLMISGTKNIKHKLVIQILYSSGIRLGELINLKRKDIDFDRNLIRINKGKGKKDRVTLLANSLKLDLLKYYSKTNFNTEYIFEGRKGKYSRKSVQKIFEKLSLQFNIDVHPHMMRHSFATHLHEKGVDIRYIQKLLGHSDLKTTEIYTKVSNKELGKIKSPLDE